MKRLLPLLAVLCLLTSCSSFISLYTASGFAVKIKNHGTEQEFSDTNIDENKL